MAKKAYIGIPEYTELAWIEATGTQYIDTGFKPSSNTRIVIDFENIGDYSSTPAAAAPLFGARTATTSDVFGMWIGATTYPHYGDTSFTAAGGFTVDINARLTYEMDGNVARIGSETITCGASTFTSTCNLYLLGMNTNGKLYAHHAYGRIYSCQIYDSGTLVRDFVPCRNASGEVGLYDRVNRVFYGNKGTGAFVAGAVVGSFADGLAHKVKKMYIGVGGVARKIKKAYIGIGGVARPCFGGGELEYYGAITPFGTARESHAATSNGKYALFAGGSSSSGSPTSVEVYDASLVHSTAPTGLSVGRYWLAATSVGEYAIFGGGYYNKANVDAYNNSLTYTSCKALSQGVCELAATTVGNYALFGGGKYVATEDTSYSYVYSYNGSLTKGSTTALSKARNELAATTVGDYAIFAGGYVGYGSAAGKYSTVDTYSASLTKSTASSLSTAARDVEATTVGDYALFAGGASGSPTATTNVVNAYNASLTRSVPTSLSVARYQLAATTVGNYAIFGGGSKTFQSSLGNSNNVDVYDESLVRTVGTSLSKARGSLAATSIGDYALFGGGNTLATVEAYVCERPEITVNISVIKSVGNTLYFTTGEKQTVTLKAKVGMKYSDLPFADANTFEIPGSNGNTLSILLHDGCPAYKITTSAGKSLTILASAGGAYVSTMLKDGMTVDFGSSYSMDDYDYSDWTFA